MRTNAAEVPTADEQLRERARFSWLTVGQVVAQLGGTVSANTVRGWITNEAATVRLKALNISTGRKVPEYRVRQEWLDEYLEAVTLNG